MYVLSVIGMAGSNVQVYMEKHKINQLFEVLFVLDCISAVTDFN